METPIDSIVAVVGFCGLLWWLPGQYMILPALAALAFPLYPVEAAQIAYVVCLFMGSLGETLNLGKV